VAILLLDSPAIPSLEPFFAENATLMVIQVLNGAIRFIIKTREQLYASKEAITEDHAFQEASSILKERIIQAGKQASFAHYYLCSAECQDAAGHSSALWAPDAEQPAAATGKVRSSLLHRHGL